MSFNKHKYKLLSIALLCFFALPALLFTSGRAYAAPIDVSTEIMLTALLSTGGEIRMTDNITLTKSVGINNDATLDLNGYTLSTGNYTLIPYSEFVVMDSSASQTGKIQGTGAGNFIIQIGGTTDPGSFVLNSGTISGTRYGVRNLAGSTLTINGGKITSPSYAVYNQGETIINDGTVLTTTGLAFQNHTGANLVMNGGTIKTEADYQALNLYGDCTATINDGEILAPKEGTTYSGNGVAMFKNTELTVNGGTISSYGNAILGNGSESGSSEGTNAKITINGGNVISETGAGIYAPQINGLTTITGGNITGRTGIEIRAGDLYVTGGNITGQGEYIITDNTNGLTTKGAAISVAQHTTKQPINVYISNGNMEGYMPVSFTNPLDNPEEDIEKIHIIITGGLYTGEDYSDVIENIAEGYIDIDEGGSILVTIPEDEEDEEDKSEITPVPDTSAGATSPETGANTKTIENGAIFDSITQVAIIVVVSSIIVIAGYKIRSAKKARDEKLMLL